MDFKTMLREANKAFDREGNEIGVATALLTDKVYVVYCRDFCQGFGEKLCENYPSLKAMLEAGDTRITKIVAAYKTEKQSGIEIPCAWLRRFIYDMYEGNAEAGVMLGSGKVYPLKELLPPAV
jgi:cytidine deaminase